MPGMFDDLIPTATPEPTTDGGITGWLGGPEKEPVAPPVPTPTPEAAMPAVAPTPAAPAVPHDEGFWGTTSGAASRGYYGLREGFDVARFDLAQRQIARIDETERKRAASGLPLPESLARTRDELRASIAPLIASAAGHRAEGAKTRPPKDVEAALQAKTFGEAWDNFKKSPVSFIYTVGLESLVRNAPGLAASIPAGLAAGPIGVGAVMGMSSGSSEYVSGIMEALQEEGVNVTDPKAIEAAVSDPARMERIRTRAAIKGGVVGAFDAASAGLASRILPGASSIASPVGRHAANLAMQVPLQGAMGAAGEAGGSLASGQEIQPGAVIGEFFGEMFGAPAEVAGLRHSRRMSATENPSPGAPAPTGMFDDLIPSAPVASPTEAPVAPAPVEGARAETPPAAALEAPARKEAVAAAERDGFDVSRPLYHGSMSGAVETFDLGRAGTRDAGHYGEGVYLSPSEGYVRNNYARDVDGNVGSISEHFVRLRNPLVWDASDQESWRNTERQIRAAMPDARFNYETIDPSQARALTDALKAAGYDGVVVPKSSTRGEEIVVFDPKNIRSAAAPISPPTTRAVDDLGYYSAAVEAAREWKQPRGTPQQAIKYLKSKGVKDAEIEATGLESFLADKKSVTREELASFLEQNRTRLMEATYSDELGFGSLSRFPTYSLDPSNPTYQERVVHLPGQDLDALESEGERLAKAVQYARTPEEVEKNQRALDAYKERVRSAKGDFQSGHFPQPNIVGHYQASQQKDAQGRNVFTLSQIQSDWGQRVRDAGIQDEKKIAALREQYEPLKAEIASSQREAMRLGVDLMSPQPNLTPEQSAALARFRTASNEGNRVGAELRTAEVAMPNPSPLVKTTDQWTNTTLRRALKDAVDSGAESIAIPSGETVLSYNPGDEHGMREFYGSDGSEARNVLSEIERNRGDYSPKYIADLERAAKGTQGIVPKNLGNLLRKMDPSIKPTTADTLKSHDGTKDLGKGFTVFPITDKVRDAVRGGQPMFAKSMNNLVADSVAKGRTHNVLPAVYKQVLAVASSPEVMRMMPIGTRIAAVKKIAPGRKGRAIITVIEADGTETVLNNSLDYLRGTTAAYEFGVFDGDPAPSILSLRLDLSGDAVQKIRGELTHEGLHALWSGLPNDVRAALISHGDSIGIMNTDLRVAFRRSGVPEEIVVNAEAGVSLYELYHEIYKDFKNYRDVMEQEIAAFMLQWYVTGALTHEQVAPVKPILDGMLDGDYARAATAEPSEGPMFALTGDGAPQTALGVIRSMGGIRDERGELRQIIDKGRSGRGSAMPGVINSRGLEPDKAREYLVQRGFLPQDSDINDMYELIRRMASGERVVAQQDQAAEFDFQERRKGEADDEAARAKIIEEAADYLSQFGLEYNLSEVEESRLFDYIREGMDMDSALERVTMETYNDIAGTAPDSRRDAAEGVQVPEGLDAAAPIGATGSANAGARQGSGQGAQPQGVTPPPIPAGNQLSPAAINYMRSSNEGGGGRGGPPRDGDITPPGDGDGPRRIADSPRIEADRNYTWGEKYRAIGRKLQAWYNPITGIPGVDTYLLGKYRTLGSISTAEDASQMIHQKLRKASDADRKATYEYLTTRDADPAMIADPRIREAAVYVKTSMDLVGQALVDRGLLSEESFNKYRGEYLPRLYLKHLVKDRKLNLGLSGGTRPSSLPYLKKRDTDLDEEVRAILGEVKDPAFLASRGIFRPLRDIAIMDFLNEISKEDQWVFRDALVPYNGHMVSPYYLRAEAVQLRDRAVLAESESPENAAKMRDKAEEMERAAAPAIQKEQNVPEGYERVPDAPRYGMLRGMYVRKEIKRDLLPSMAIIPDDAPYLQQLFRPGGPLQRLNSYFKAMKVPLNPGTQVRNILSNLIMMNLSGVPAHRIVPSIDTAIEDFINNGPYWKFVKQHGIKASGFSEQELGKVAREYLKLERQLALQGKAGYVVYPATVLRQLVDKGIAPFSTAYQFSETIGKMAKMVDAHEREGLPMDKSFLEAQKWLFDYNSIPNWVRYMRNAPLGMPFVTYSYLALPRIIETAATKPWRMAPYVAVPFVLAQMFKLANDVDDDDIDKLWKTLPEWLRKKPNSTILPYKDAKGRWQAYDYGYLLPWGQMQDAAGDLMRGDPMEALKGMGVFGGPFSQLFIGAKTGIDAFTGRPIFDKTDPPSVKYEKIAKWMARMALPPLLTDQSAALKAWDAIKDKPSKGGDPPLTVGQAALRLFGQNIYPLEPEVQRQRNIARLRKEIKDIEIKRKYETRDKTLDDKGRAERRKVYDDFIKGKRDELRKYIKESAIPDKLRTDIRSGKKAEPEPKPPGLFDDLIPKPDDRIPR